MRKAPLAILAVVATTAVLIWVRNIRSPSSSMFTKDIDPEGRVAEARRVRTKVITDKFHAAAVQYPGEIYIRWFKHESTLELWARNPDRRFRLIASYPILAASGRPGPKRKEGDKQVPEGFYEIDRFNPTSSFHLSLGLNYPNPADLLHADPQQPGSDIFIHGGNQSIGCAPIGDDGIEEVYLAALDAHSTGQQRIPVHVFPARMTGADWTTFMTSQTASRPELAPFWDQLRPAYEAFERYHVVPHVEITSDGRYSLKPEK